MDSSSNLRCLLIAVQSGQLILPSNLITEVLPFATPLRIEEAPPWVVGTMLWRNLPTPLVSLGQLIFRVTPEADLNSRIVFVNALGADAQLSHFGILGTSAPRPLDLRRQDLQPDFEIPASEQTRPGVLIWARYREQPVVVPDLEAIEAVLRPLIRRA